MSSHHRALTVLLGALVLAAEVPAAPTQGPLPGVPCTFALSFDDETLTATQSGGKPQPLAVTGQTAFVPGVVGKALCLLADGTTVTYARQGNLTLPGAVSFWLQPRRDRLPGQATYFWWTRDSTAGYLGVQDNTYTQLDLWLQYFRGVSDRNVLGSFPWEKGRWYHVALNLSQKVELYLDGRLLGSATLERSLSESELGPFILGHPGPNQFALDELRLFSRTLTPDEIRTLSLGSAALEGRISYYPTPNRLALEASATAQALEQGRFEMVVATGQQVLARYPFPATSWRALPGGTLSLMEAVGLPELQDGTYAVWLQESRSDGTPAREHLRRDFVVRHYEWQNNTLGKSHTIIPPFTPLEVRGDKVNAILRTHTLGDLGLWSQVVSLDRRLLARPIRLQVQGAGKLIRGRATDVHVVVAQPDMVSVAAHSRYGPTDVSALCTFDYDGLMKVDLTLAPAAAAVEAPVLDRVWLEIPVRPDVATLFHAVGEQLRANPAGEIPAGRGVVWQSRSLQQPHLDNFIPYLWVGGEERGICWAADWDKDWVHAATNSAVELLREADAVTIRVNFISQPIALTAPRTFTFGLHASPVKPLPADWRQRVFDFHYPGRGRYPLLQPWSVGFHYSWGSVYPLDQDFSLVRELAEATRHSFDPFGPPPNPGEYDPRALIAGWQKKVLGHDPAIAADALRAELEFGFHCARGLALRQPPGKLIYYTCMCYGTLTPEKASFADEWLGQEGQMHSSDSWVDLAVWSADRMLECGMGGIYLDNAFLLAKYNWPLGEGYVDEQGTVHPSFGIWRQRAHVRRLATMMCDKGREPLLWVHMTNANLLPVLSFAQANLSWEWKAGSSDFQDRFTPDYVRAESIGRQAGTIPIVLGQVEGIPTDSAEYVRVTRTALALALPHEIFFYGGTFHCPTALQARDIIAAFRDEPGTTAYPYWEKGAVLQTSGNLLVTAYRHQGELLLVIGNLAEAGTYTVTLDAKGLQLKEITSAVNAETQAAIPVAGAGLTLAIAKHDLALVRVQCR
jgi:hypothetical protein